MNAHNEQQWPEYLMLRDTGLSDDAGGLGQRIYTTAGAGYEKQKYVRADIATQPAAAQEVVAWQRRYIGATRGARPVEWHNITKDEFEATKAGKWADRYEVRALYAAPVTAAPVGDLFVECRQCEECNHAGINDSGDNLAACLACYWSGMAPDEDRCPECDQTGCMSAACPKCGARYKLVASAEFPASTPAAPGIDLEPFRRLVEWNYESEFSAYENGFRTEEQREVAEAERKRLLALIDASPKGDDAEDCIDRAVEAFDDVFDGVSYNKREAIAAALAAGTKDSPKGGSEAAWDDCKVAFGFDGDEELIWDAWKRGQLSLPSGWTFSETDGAGARLVAVFRVDGMPSPQDGETVRRMLDGLSKAQAGDAEVQP